MFSASIYLISKKNQKGTSIRCQPTSILLHKLHGIMWFDQNPHSWCKKLDWFNSIRNSDGIHSSVFYLLNHRSCLPLASGILNTVMPTLEWGCLYPRLDKSSSPLWQQLSTTTAVLKTSLTILVVWRLETLSTSCQLMLTIYYSILRTPWFHCLTWCENFSILGHITILRSALQKQKFCPSRCPPP